MEVRGYVLLLASILLLGVGLYFGAIQLLLRALGAVAYRSMQNALPGLLRNMGLQGFQATLAEAVVSSVGKTLGETIQEYVPVPLPVAVLLLLLLGTLTIYSLYVAFSILLRLSSVRVDPSFRDIVSKSITHFTPSVNTEETAEETIVEYRFRFSRAGLFHCSVTGLVFGMAGGGEVLYRSVQWEDRWLQSTGGTPAGPLFDIQCPQQSICQLHMPHCDATPDHFPDLSVAHITDKELNFLEPQKVTKTHVIVNVTHLSLFGLLWRIYNYFKQTSGEVVLFRPPQRGLRRKLWVFLLPSNLPLDEVKAKRNKDEYIETTSNCYLTPSQVYRLQCTSYKVQPKAVKYRLNYGPNYIPTFEVKLDLNAEEVSLTLLGPENNLVWEGDIELEVTGPTPLMVMMTPSQDMEEPLRSRRAEFIQRVSKPVLHSLLDRLLDQRVLNEEEMSSIRAQGYREEEARSFYDTLKKKGNRARSKMMDALHQLDPSLYEVLMGAD